MASVAKAHAACKALPGATYDVKWGKALVLSKLPKKTQAKLAA